MRIGSEGDHIIGSKQRGAIGSLQFAHEQGLEGVFFKGILDVSPTLDPGELREAKACADSLGLYLEAGVGRINPYNTAESPQVRQLGGGDYRLAVIKRIEACRSIGCTELWAETATYKRTHDTYFVFDRFRTDAPWEDQLAATAKFLASLRPVLEDQGCRVNVETHEEISSFEVARLCETVGPDIVGCTFDTANVLARGEVPMESAKRLAPYVHTSHVKDAILFFTDQGLAWQFRPIGQGVIDWDVMIDTLAPHKPDLNLSLEDSNGVMGVQIYDPAWHAMHPDLTVLELSRYVQLARVCEGKIARGEILSPDAYLEIPMEEKQLKNAQASKAHLLAILEKRGLHSSAPVAV
jgi:sugar phosphate isomerase/epimerase